MFLSVKFCAKSESHTITLCRKLLLHGNCKVGRKNLRRIIFISKYCLLKKKKKKKRKHCQNTAPKFLSVRSMKLLAPNHSLPTQTCVLHACVSSTSYLIKSSFKLPFYTPLRYFTPLYTTLHYFTVSVE